MASKPKHDRLAAAKRFYAAMAAAAGGELRSELERAFEFIPREHFLGAGPWQALSVPTGLYLQTPTDDPIHVYQNTLFALDRGKGINNGEPCLHGQLLGALHPNRGDAVLHIGCGTGYYSAVLAQLVGPAGSVIAYEIDPELARRAAAALKPWDNVEVRANSGTAAVLPPCDAVYVNAGATRPLAAWLDALREGGRLVFPLSSSGQNRSGVSLAVIRIGQAFASRAIGYSAFIDCGGATDADEGARVAAAFHSGALWRTRSLIRDDKPDDNAVLIGTGWWLSSASP